MKKKLVLFLVLSMVILAFSACGGGTTETPAEETPTADVVKTGLAVITSTAKSADAGDENGVAQVDSTAVALMLDDSGTIVNCVIDSAQTMIEFSKQGRIVTPLDSVFPAKQELGEEYGMGEASTIGKEWNEQADALSSYVIGKTFDEVKSIAVNEEGNPTDEDLASSVTIKIGGFIDAIEKAAANARNLGAAFNDKLGLGIVTTIANSADAGEEDGVAQAYTYYTASTFNGEGVITGSIIDASQTDVNFSKEGKITSDIMDSYKTKNEEGFVNR